MKAGRSRKGLRVVALFEGAKGAVVLLAGFGLLFMIHRDVHEVAAQIIQQIHINPAHHYPRVFLDLMDRVDDQKLWAMALGAMAYSVVRMVEAVGLWTEQRWAELFGLLTGIMYIPAEIYEVLKGVTALKCGVLAVNVGIVCYLAVVVKRQEKRRKKRHG